MSDHNETACFHCGSYLCRWGAHCTAPALLVNSEKPVMMSVTPFDYPPEKTKLYFEGHCVFNCGPDEAIRELANRSDYAFHGMNGPGSGFFFQVLNDEGKMASIDDMRKLFEEHFPRENDRRIW